MKQHLWFIALAIIVIGLAATATGCRATNTHSHCFSNRPLHTGGNWAMTAN